MTGEETAPEATGTPQADPAGLMRLFIAIPLPDEIIRRLDALTVALKKGFQFTPCRPSWVAAESIHLTLRFLGASDGSKIEPLGAALEKAAAAYAPFQLHAQELGVFPDWRRPRVLWVGLAEATGKLKSFQQEIELLAVALGFEPSSAPFHPHLTLARFRSQKGVNAARGIVQSHQDFRSPAFTASEAVLYRSELRNERAKHFPISRALFKH